MPEILKSCVRNLQEEGKTESAAYAVCVARLGPNGSGLIRYDKEKSEYVLTEKGMKHESEKRSG